MQHLDLEDKAPFPERRCRDARDGSHFGQATAPKARGREVRSKGQTECYASPLPEAKMTEEEAVAAETNVIIQLADSSCRRAASVSFSLCHLEASYWGGK